MALGRRKPKQEPLFITPDQQRRAPAHVFYDALEGLLVEAGFDEFVEALCKPYFAERGRPSIPPGRYFRMLIAGYFEDIDSQRGIEWRFQDSLSLQAFLGLAPDERVPDHSSLTRTRQRYPQEVFDEVFRFVLGLAESKGLMKGESVAVDATLLEANAAMRSIVRRDTGDSYQEWLRKLILEEEGNANPSAEELARFDRARSKGREGDDKGPGGKGPGDEGKGAPSKKAKPAKRVSNKEWESKTDPDSRIAKMKNGSTHLAYKAENVVDLETDLLLAAEIETADTGDTASMMPSLLAAQGNLLDCAEERVIGEVVADKGYHKAALLHELKEHGVRTYIPERKERRKRRWKNKPEGWKTAFHGNRQRMRTAKGRRLQRRRSELIERTFAHMCGTGGGRRMHVRGLKAVRKRWTSLAFARNLGVILRALTGVGTARSLQDVGRGRLDRNAAMGRRICDNFAASITIAAQMAMWLRDFPQPITRLVTTRHLRPPAAAA